MPAETAALKRRGLRLSLRVMLLLVLVAGVWMARQVNKARQQREADRPGGTLHLGRLQRDRCRYRPPGELEGSQEGPHRQVADDRRRLGPSRESPEGGATGRTRQPLLRRRAGPPTTLDEPQDAV